MGEDKSMFCGWTWEENKLFELALAVVDEQDPDRWEAVAALVGGDKNAEDAHKHYMVLVEDLQFIEGGFMDNELEMEDDHNQNSDLQIDHPQTFYWTDEYHKYSSNLQALLRVQNQLNQSLIKERKCLPPSYMHIFVIHYPLM